MFPAQRFRAFTLIELLIVVAIIAILAAIAVPNFLEAQTRAKVSRSLADMRSIGVAIEAYAVDANAYPRIPSWPNPGWENPIHWLTPLTTPVAYLSRLPRYPWEPFTINFTGAPMKIDYYYYNEYESFYFPGGLPWTIWDPSGNSRWYLSAAGPDGDLDQDWTPQPGSNYHLYDPSNGTVSDGDLIRLGP
jgi:prepilin-type N-terminal cleavage/methylation domain-containing protein